MKLTREEWKRLRAPLVIFAIVLIIVTLTVSVVEDHRNSVQSALQAQENQLNQARSRYQTSGHEKETIVQYLPSYTRLIHEGFIGEERRIEWVDTLRNIHQQQKLFKINYAIASQQDYKPEFLLNAGVFKLKSSTMKLDLAMLHEGDLITLLEELHARETTPFIVRDCEIIRVNQAIATSFIPNMQAHCELDWLTVHEPQREAGK